MQPIRRNLSSGMTHANSCCGYFRHPALEKAVNYGLDKAQSVVM